MAYIDDKFKIKSAKALEKHIIKITAVEVMCIKMADVVRVIWALDNKLHHYDIKAHVIYCIQEEELQLAVDVVMDSYKHRVKKEIPVITDWNNLQLVDTDVTFDEDGNKDMGEYGICIRRNYLKANYPNGVIIKTE